MKILILANKPPYPPNDGGAFATLNMTLGLAESGAKVTLLAMSTPKHPTTANDFPQDIRDRIGVETVFVNTRLSAINALLNLLFSKHAYNAQRFISKAYSQQLEEILTHQKFDIVQLEGLYLYTYMDVIRKHHKGIVSYRAHNVENEIWTRNAEAQNNWLKRWYFTHLARRIKRAEKQLLKQVDLLVSISERDEEILKKMGYSGSAMASSTGYMLERTAPITEDFEFPSVFHLGSLDWIPNQEGLLWFLESCWPHVLTSVPDAIFYVAGRNASDELIKKITGYTNTVFLGEVDDAVEFMNSKAIMVVPLLSGSGMRIKIVEGMALGKAIVSTAIGAEGIDVKSGEHLSIADTPYAMAIEIVELCSSKEKVVAMGKSAQNFVEQHLDNAALTARLAEFYHKTLNP